ncbi:MAG: VWA domain-containing protein [Promethearchaeota archaeon]
MAGEYFLEDTVLLLDTSRSMMITDFKPRRIHAALRMAWSFVENKLAIDFKDRVAVVTFGQRARKLADFSSDLEKLKAVFTRVEVSGNGSVTEGLGLAIQLLGKEILKIGGKVQRVLVVTDSRVDVKAEKMKVVAELAKGLGIFVDCCVLGNVGTGQNVFKALALHTGGEFGFFKNERALLTAGKGFASKKPVGEEELYSLTKKQKEAPKYLKDLAVNLRRPGIGELKLLVSGKVREKCQICYAEKCPVTGGPFYSCGRYCPNCGRPLHLYCAAMWAQKSPELGENVLRCPFCYFLLKVPKAVLKIVEKEKVDVVTDSKAGPGGEPTHMEEVLPEDVPSIEGSCSWCNSIFTGELKAFRCDHCGAYYHLPCLEEMYSQIKACRNCGRPIE